jgi:hypothetical protein
LINGAPAPSGPPHHLIDKLTATTTLEYAARAIREARSQRRTGRARAPRLAPVESNRDANLDM